MKITGVFFYKNRFGPLVSFVLVSLLISCVVVAQERRKIALTEKDYHLWGTLTADKISATGKWASYQMTYEDADTLFVQHAVNKTKYQFAKGRDGRFSGDAYFACLTDSTLNVVNLRTGGIEILPQVLEYGFVGDGTHLAVLESDEMGRRLTIRKSSGGMLKVVDDATYFKASPVDDALLYAGLHFVGIVSFGKESAEKVVVNDAMGAFSNFSWQSDGSGLAFIKKLKIDGVEVAHLMYYNTRESKLFEMAPETVANFPADMIAEARYGMKPVVSDDGSKVFFYIKKKTEAPKDADVVQVWNGNDKWIFPMEQKMGNGIYPKVAVWWPGTNKVVQVSDEARPRMMLTGNQKYAITSNPQDYEPQYKENGDRDYYITELETSVTKLMVPQQSGNVFMMNVSPTGNYAAYHKDGSWWVYDILSGNSTIAWHGNQLGSGNISADPGSGLLAYGSPGWTFGDEKLLVYDQYDIWEASPRGGVPKRLTNGRREGIRFRIAALEFAVYDWLNYDGQHARVFDLRKPILLEAVMESIGATGYYLLHPNGEVRKLAFGDSAIDGAVRSAGGHHYLIREQRFDRSPTISVVSTVGKQRVVATSNRHQQNYLWGSSEMIAYKDAGGNRLNGALFYPAGYDARKRYPLVVWIYEKQSRDIHQYVNPSRLNMEGINTTNLTSQGYLVLLPDIAYGLGNTGFFALDCITAAVGAVVEKGIVKTDAIGLIGHSFGGYETDFIIGQTDLFACAVSGAAVTDMRSMYFNVPFNATTRPDLWRFETQQWRMGKSFDEDQDAYNSNSPIVNARKITTPLLSYTGIADNVIPWEQSVAFYLALRRLGKKHIMLAYPNEQHVLLQAKNQTDLTQRVEEWFAAFLKKESPVPWISKGIAVKTNAVPE